MSAGHAWVRAAVVGSVFALAGCGGASGGSSSANVVRIDGCAVREPHARLVRIHTTGVLTASGLTMGEGRGGVVMANQSDRDLCSWVPFAHVLVDAGFRVLLFDYSGAEPQVDLGRAVGVLRRRGADEVGLIGASVGARAVLVAGSEPGNHVAAVVSLSAENSARTGPARLAPYLSRLRAPLLLVTSRRDPYTAETRDTHDQYRRARSTTKRLVEVPGSAHGVDLLGSVPGKKISPLVVAFFRQHLPR